MRTQFLGKTAWVFIRKYRITILLWLTIVLFGLASYTTLLKREGFPNVAIPVAVVSGTYFVNDSERVDSQVIIPLTDELKTIGIVDQYQASSGSNYYTITVNFDDGVTSEAGTNELRQILGEVNIPPEASIDYTVIEPAKINNRYSALVGVYERGATTEELQKKATELALLLNDDEEIQVAELVPVLEDVEDPASGNILKKRTKISKIIPQEDTEHAPLQSITIGIVRSETSDDLRVASAIQDALDSPQAKTILQDSQASITADFATNIEAQIDSLENNLLGGLAAVIVVTLLLISWRAALVIALFIPTVLASTFLGLGLFGLTLNTITLFAVILTLGLFVDDATIVVEAIDAHRRDRSSAQRIVTSAMQRIGIATIAGSLTTILVFAPMLLVSGVLGEFIRLLPITVMMALTISLVLSVILVPFFSRIFILGLNRFKFLDTLSILVPFEKMLADKLSRIPTLGKRNRYKARLAKLLIAELSILMLIGAVYFAGKLPFEIFPQTADANYIRVTMQFEANTTIEKAESISDEIDGIVLEQVGTELDYITYLQGNERTIVTEIGLTDYTTREQTVGDIVKKLQDNTPVVAGAEINYRQLDAGPPVEEYPFQLRLYGTPTDLPEASRAISQFMSDRVVAGTQVSDVRVNPNQTINRTEEGEFVDIVAKFSSEESVSENVIALREDVEAEFTEEKLSQLNAQRIDYEISQESDNAESFSSMGIGVAVALLAMYILLVLLFDSFSQPLLILLAVPFGMFGVFAGLYATGNSLSFFSLLGIMGLIGIAVNNSILLTEYANQERAGGADPHDAISRALKERFRALLTTTATTIFALLPLALSDPFWRPLAYTIIFGLLASTFFIITSFPYFYIGLERIRDRVHAKK